MKAVEIMVRDLANFADDVVGVDLMNQAFGPSGRLTDPDAVKGEQEGTRAMFAGATPCSATRQGIGKSTTKMSQRQLKPSWSPASLCACSIGWQLAWNCQ